MFPENIFQNKRIDNHISAISGICIRPSNVYNKTSKKISRNSDENVNNKKLKVISNPKSKETIILKCLEALNIKTYICKQF